MIYDVDIKSDFFMRRIMLVVWLGKWFICGELIFLRKQKAVLVILRFSMGGG
jgi:hypothetical protein